MKLNIENLKNRTFWEKNNIEIPSFDIEKMIKYTNENPSWVHFGTGNIFRAFIADLQQSLLNKGIEKSGIVAIDNFDYDIIEKICEPYDNLTMVVSMKSNGNLEKKVVASIAEALKGDVNCAKDYNRLRNIFINPKLQMVSYTITEKGYALKAMDGSYFPVVMEDITNGPAKPKHVMSFTVSLLWERYNNGAAPLAVVSMDNCSHNGEKLKNSIVTIAKEWAARGFVDEDFIGYLEDEARVSYPWSMIDKITPRPSDEVKAVLSNIGIERMEQIITSKNTYIAPFVNAEAPQYLVIEDKFPNGRPKLEEAGVYLTDRDTVNNTEKMKVTTCLNPLHTALAVYGCLLGHTSIAGEMKDSTLKNLVEKIGYEEGMPVVVNPGIINPMEFINEVINERLSNTYIPDAPQRIATDTSQKVAIRFGETIKSYAAREDLHPGDLKYIPLVLAGWMRYLLGVDDEGNTMQLSSDPMLDELTEKLKGIELGKPETYNDELKEVLKNSALFAVNLYEVGLGEKVENYFKELIAGKGAVRSTLEKYLN